MTYEEFQERTGRKDITFAMYNDAIEPLYMDEKLDKDQFCEMVKNVPIEMIPVLVANVAQKRSAEEALTETTRELTEMTKCSRTFELAIHNIDKELRKLRAGILFDPEATIHCLKADNFNNYSAIEAEAREFGIVK